MNRIGEIDWRGTTRQRNKTTLRRKAEDLILKQFQLCVFEELFRIIAFGKLLNGLTQPSISIGFGRNLMWIAGAAAILVNRMSGNTEFCNFIHDARADLQLDTLARWTDNRRVDRTVVVLLGRRNIVFEPARNHRPRRVDQTKRAVAVLCGFNHNAEAENIGKLFERQALGFHFTENRPRLLLTAFDARLDAVLLKNLRQVFFNLLQKATVLSRSSASRSVTARHASGLI